MKILTWNINGIRSVKRENSLKYLFDSLDVDIICLQETKVTRDMLQEETAIVEGYNSYFSFSKVRSGYSGVATFCRDDVTPIKAEDKICLLENYVNSDSNGRDRHLTNEELETLNAEGRAILTEHLDSEGNHVVIINLYCPRADLDNKERTQFKLGFYSLIEQKCKSLVKENKHVLVLGDFNVSHKLIDHCDPDDPEIFDSNPSRRWANKFILDTSSEELDENSTKFVDSFRQFHPHQESAFTCWSTVTGARQTNYGTRIDYIFSSVMFFKKEFSDCVIRPDIEGSDHCPVVATLKTSFRNAGKPPPLCTKYMPEFAGKQQKLNAFFKMKDFKTKSTRTNESKSECFEKVSRDVEKGAEKRSASVLLTGQPKRLKTGSNASGGNIFQFFSKKSTTSKNHSVEETMKSQESNICKESQCSGNPCLGLSDLNQDCMTDDIGKDMSKKHVDMSLENNSDSSQSLKSETSPSSSQNSSEENSPAVVAQWRSLLKGPPPAPLCSGHNEPCVLRTVKNKGPNHGKQFYCCARPQGHHTNKEARCKFFKWVKK